MRQLAFLSLLALAFAGCAGAESDEVEIEVIDNQFEGGDKTVDAGTTIEFDNEGTNVHNVHVLKMGATAPLLDKDLQHGDKIEHKFTEPGMYHVWCDIHGEQGSGMHMTLTVA